MDLTAASSGPCRANASDRGRGARLRLLVAALLGLTGSDAARLAITGSGAAYAQSVAPFSTAPLGAPPPPWRVVTLPKIPRHTHFAVIERDGERVLRVAADGSYANLLHELGVATTAAPILRWRWRVDALSPYTDLTRKDGDDVPARLCVLFDLPLERLSFGARTALRLGRALFDPGLPAATICYVWDARLAPGTWLANAYTERVQMLVLQAGVASEWKRERRDLRTDFARAFPAEAAPGEPLRIAAIGIAADGDNTGARSLAFFGDVTLERD